MNYMPEIAKMLGVELGEEFKIEGEADNFRYKLTEEHLKFTTDGTWYILPATITRLLSGEDKVVKIPKPILTEKEKKYLSLVIEPWKNEIKYMVKIGYDDMEYIMIVFDDLKEMPFPHFKKGKYYKGMEWDKEYSLEELGL